MTDQLTAADIASLSHAEIDQAREAGRLDVLLGVDPAEVALRLKVQSADQRLSVADVQQLAAFGRHDLIDQARKSDRIDYPTNTGEAHV